jgi:hypothetical protein
MKLDVILEKTSAYVPHYNANDKVVGGSAEEWQQRIGITKENRDEITKKALEELKKSKTWKDAEALGLKDITTDRVKSLASVWENALKEVNKKYTDMLEKIKKSAEKA